ARHVARQLAGQRAVGAEEFGEIVGKHDAGRGVDTGQPQDDTPGIPTQRHGYGKMRRLFRFYATHMTMTSSESQTHAVDPARVLRLLTAELDARPAQVAAAVDLLDSGATVPFIARYRKEATGGLDDTVLRQLEVRLLYIRELESRRVAILDSIAGQGKLDDALRAQILEADSKQRLEDLYAPYKPKRRTRAQIAREAGLEPLVDAILDDAQADPVQLAAAYVNAEAGVADAKAALDGARDILAERYAENADLLADMREHLWSTGRLYSKVVESKQAEGDNFRDWFDFNERLNTLPSRRILALLRGRQQGVLDLRLGLEAELESHSPHPCVARIANRVSADADFAIDAPPRARWLAE